MEGSHIFQVWFMIQNLYFKTKDTLNDQDFLKKDKNISSSSDTKEINSNLSIY